MDIKPGDPYDINGACFNAEMYVKKVLKVKIIQIHNLSLQSTVSL